MPGNKQPTPAHLTFRIRATGRSYRDYSGIAVTERTTLLDVLEYIRTHNEPDLMYRHSCHHGSCGTCGILVDGKPALVCLTRPYALERSTIQLDPLPAFRHIGGLVVDMAALVADFPADATYLRASESAAAAPVEVGSFERLENCIECGLCQSGCPVTRRFMGPAALAALHREIENRPERRDELLDRAQANDGVTACDRHFVCSRVCPAGVNPGRRITELRRLLKQRSDARK